MDIYFDNLLDLLTAARNAAIKNNCEISLKDDYKKLLIGFYCPASDENFIIKLSHFKMELSKMENDNLHQFMKKLMQKSADREIFAKIISQNNSKSLIEIISQCYDLKVFL